MTDKTDTFTKDELERIESSPDFTLPMRHLAAFALAQMEGKEADERELIERGKDIHTLTCALESKRLELAEAEEALLCVTPNFNTGRSEVDFGWEDLPAVLRARERAK